LVLSAYSLFFNRLKPSIDFTGGSFWEFRFSQEVTKEDLTAFFNDYGFAFNQLKSNDGFLYVVSAPPLEQSDKQPLQLAIEEKFGQIQEHRFETLGPNVGKELLFKTVTAVCSTTILILFYLAWRLKNLLYGLGAILGMLHDSFILLGVFSWLGKFWGVQIDTLFVTAVLTTLSFSVHDTVVIYNSVQEEVKKSGGSLIDSINFALNRTIIRSINNSLTIIFMLLALVLLGGGTIRWFVVALLVGTILGTYSSTFLATPLLLELNKIFKLKK